MAGLEGGSATGPRRAASAQVGCGLNVSRRGVSRCLTAPSFPPSDFTLKERNTRETPLTIDQNPMTVSIASAPSPGRDSMDMPKRMETAPPRIIHHSPSISLRSRTAMMMRSRPEAIAQKPI